jgi:CBS domain-containing protein
MTHGPVTVGPETPAATVARLLVERCFNGVPVVDDGVLVGMIGRADLLGLLIGDE